MRRRDNTVDINMRWMDSAVLTFILKIMIWNSCMQTGFSVYDFICVYPGKGVRSEFKWGNCKSHIPGI